MDIQVKTSMPGLREARIVEDKIRAHGIQDIKLFYDKDIKPQGMWCVCQVKKVTSQLYIPETYMENNIQPLILWWCKDNEGKFRLPNENDVHDAIVTALKAQKIWDKGGDALDDEFKKQDAEKDRKHREKQRERIHEVAPKLQKIIQRDLSQGKQLS